MTVQDAVQHASETSDHCLAKLYELLSSHTIKYKM